MLQRRPHLKKVYKKYSLGCIALRINEDGVMHADKAGERELEEEEAACVL